MRSFELIMTTCILMCQLDWSDSTLSLHSPSPLSESQHRPAWLLCTVAARGSCPAAAALRGCHQPAAAALMATSQSVCVQCQSNHCIALTSALCQRIDTIQLQELSVVMAMLCHVIPKWTQMLTNKNWPKAKGWKVQNVHNNKLKNTNKSSKSMSDQIHVFVTSILTNEREPKHTL